MVLLTKLSSFLAPFNLYFSVSTLVVGSGAGFSPQALLIKLSIPLLTGFLLCAIPLWISRKSAMIHTKLGRSLNGFGKQDAVATSQASAFFGSLLMSWPMIVHWDVLAAVEIREYQVVFFCAYLIYFVSYALMARGGAKLALAFVGGEGGPQWISTARDSFVGAFMSGLAGALVVVLVGR